MRNKKMEPKAMMPLAMIRPFLEMVKGKIDREQDVLRRHGFVFDDLDDRWQKLAFTLFSDIVDLSTQAAHILEQLEEDLNAPNRNA